jgi:hypothetical protein
VILIHVLQYVYIAIVEKNDKRTTSFPKIHLHNIDRLLFLEVARLLRDDPNERLLVDSEV